MKGSRGLRVLKVALMGVVAVAVFGLVVMSLWNWLVPALTGWHALNFAQALGLFVLCRLLFGGFGRGGLFRERMRARFEHMTPEEREQFRARFGGRFPGDCQPAADRPTQGT